MVKFGVGKTDVGTVRTNNEDSIFISNDMISFLPNLFIVADGMGGHNAGEVASKKSIEYFVNYFESTNKKIENYNNELVNALIHANNEIYELSLTDDKYFGMGTTFSAVVIENNIVHIVQVGDSRIYKITKNEIAQITEDHSFVNMLLKQGNITQEEARNHPKRNMITRAIGTDSNVEVDYFSFILDEKNETDDYIKILICSDGLTNMIEDVEIKRIINENPESDVAILELILKAKQNGGNDNISAIII